MPDFLESMVIGSEARMGVLRRRSPDLQRQAVAAPPAPPLRCELGGFGLIAEIKRRSPSAGDLGPDTDDLVARARAYAAGGALAISVLTEPTRFAGSMTHLREIAEAVAPLGIPVMRKDFLVDPLQVVEARAAGAGGVLLIARMLDDARLAAMVDTAGSLGLFVLVECFDAADAKRAGAALADFHGLALVGVNNRNLATLAVDEARLAELATHLPPARPWVAESGILTPNDAAAAGALGYDLALVGTALMQSEDPAGLVAALTTAGREGRARART